jgi:hypothetical protein
MYCPNARQRVEYASYYIEELAIENHSAHFVKSKPV